jgi:hypothetical protein
LIKSPPSKVFPNCGSGFGLQLWRRENRKVHSAASAIIGRFSRTSPGHARHGARDYLIKARLKRLGQAAEHALDEKGNR